MPKRKLIATSEAALAAFKLGAVKQPPMSADEERVFETFRSSARIGRLESNYVATKRRGEWVFRYEGESGADLTEHPLTIQCKTHEARFLTALAKLFRIPPVTAAVRARRANAEILERRVRALLAEKSHLGSGAAQVVANKLGISAEHVRRIRKKQT